MKVKTTALIAALGCCMIISILMLICHDKKNNTPKEYIERIDVSSYTSIEDIKLASAFAAGAFDLSTYQEAQQFVQKRIEDKIRFSDFSRKDIYATEEKVSKSAKLIKISDLQDKNSVQQYILYASKDKRVIYSVAAFSQGDTAILKGTLITVIPKFNEDGKVKGKMNQGRQIFIPNF
ncbi:MAG: hypothetical protein IK013_07405 [Bacteroidales bacterium]|nr:hypothetical protein [Bacteroidales bacterium]